MTNSNPSKSLKDLFKTIPVKNVHPVLLSDELITGIVFDSRNIKPGNLFVALSGGQVDGHQFIRKAVENGASAVVGTKEIDGLQVPYLQVEETRSALAYLSAAFYDFPARKLAVIGVTGTDGKTTTANYIYQILLAAGLRTGIISTVKAVIGDEEIDTGFHVTTPESPYIQNYLARMVHSGMTHVVIEATSHGLSQKRVEACEFDVGVVTNITHEHLDYHGTYEEYRSAKAMLFNELKRTVAKPQGNPRLGIINYDDQSYSYLDSIIENKITYSRNSDKADLWAENIHIDKSGIRFEAVGKNTVIPISTSLIGDYNVSNCLAAVAATILGLKIEAEAASRGIAQLSGVTGRMERIEMGQDFLAIVDFAHTPNALRRALEAAREMTSQRVIAVFGSAGLRDRQKRRLMAEISVQLADITILTAEDPRTESLDAILEEMADAAIKAGGCENRTFWRVPDRGEALTLAVGMAKTGDIVIGCGKGHEQSMCFGETEYLWDDKTAMQAALAQRLNIEGPDMPYLPTQEKK